MKFLQHHEDKMDINSIGIPLTFIIVISISLWFIILGKGYWWAKAIVVALTLYFSIGMWAALSGLAGWPADQALPEKFLMHWALVKEPSKNDINQKGAILIWATEDSESNKENSIFPLSKNKNINQPRVYKLPYSEDMHEKLTKVMKQMAQGKGVRGEKSGEGGEKGEKGNGKNGEKKGKGYGSLSQEQDYIFYELPPAKLPEKD